MFLISSALAAGFTVPGTGVEGLGRGGANIAGVDDLSAQNVNPAALTRVEDAAMLQLGATESRVFFDRADEDQVFEPVRDTAGPLTSPNLAYGRAVGPVHVAIGAWTPYGPRFSFDGDGAQRFTLTDMTVLSGKVGPSLAWEPMKGLSIGGGGQWTFVQVEQGLVAHLAPLSFQPDDNPDYDIETTIVASDFNEFTWNVGVLFDRDRFAVGASYAPRIVYEARGSMTSDLSTNVYYTGEGPLGKLVENPVAVDEDVAITVVLPPTARLGVVFRPSDRSEIELASTWERWSVMPALSVTDLDLVVETTLEEDAVITAPVTLPMQMKDAWAVHLGGHLDVSDRLTTRAGVFGETAAIAPEYRSVMVPDGNKLGYGLGASIGLGQSLELDLGWQHGIVPRTTTDDSWVTQVQLDPQTGDVGVGKLVGDGELGAHHMVLGVGLDWAR